MLLAALALVAAESATIAVAATAAARRINWNVSSFLPVPSETCPNLVAQHDREPPPVRGDAAGRWRRCPTCAATVELGQAPIPTKQRRRFAGRDNLVSQRPLVLRERPARERRAHERKREQPDPAADQP
ncbi:MAG: hypothetical protein ACYCU0_13440 [Solirubrobacteraceae bacterium]